MSSEVDKAKSAKRTEVTIFEKIISKEIKADIIHEDEKCLAFNDVSPQGPVHFLVIPKRKIPMLDDAKVDDKEVSNIIWDKIIRNIGQISENNMHCSKARRAKSNFFEKFHNFIMTKSQFYSFWLIVNWLPKRRRFSICRSHVKQVKQIDFVWTFLK